MKMLIISSIGVTDTRTHSNTYVISNDMMMFFDVNTNNNDSYYFEIPTNLQNYELLEWFEHLTPPPGLMPCKMIQLY